jgi:hypothetical protein
MKRESIAILITIIVIFSATIAIDTLILTEFSKKTGLHFTDEDVFIYINDTIAYFYARYALKNYGEITQYRISLPFALKPWNITLLFNEQELVFTWSKIKLESEPMLYDAIYFDVDIAKNQKLDIEVYYQRNYEVVEIDNTTKGLYRYIVGSTRSWGHPLIFAHFEFYKITTEPVLLEERHYTNWYPKETFLYFYFDL